MSSPPQVHVPERLLTEGVSIIGIGIVRAAYTARLSSLGVPVRIFNRNDPDSWSQPAVGMQTCAPKWSGCWRETRSRVGKVRRRSCSRSPLN